MTYLTQTSPTTDCAAICFINFARWMGKDWDESDIPWLGDALMSTETGTSIMDMLAFTMLLAPKSSATFSNRADNLLRDLDRGHGVILATSFKKADVVHRHVSFLFKRRGKYIATNMQMNMPECELSADLIRVMVKCTSDIDGESTHITLPKRK